jgi:hypothetical protein
VTSASRVSGDRSTTTAAPGRGVVAIGWVMALWCIGFAAANVVLIQETGHFADSAFPEYAAGLSVLSWVVFALKLLGAAVALLSVSRLPGALSPRLVAVLVWGAAALLGVYALGSVVEAVGIVTGMTGSPDDITLKSIGYVLFFVLGAIGYGVLARSFSRRYETGRRTALVGLLGGPLMIGVILVAIPAVLVALGVMPA